MWKSRTGINTPRNKIPQPEWKRWHVIEDLIKTRGWTRGIELGVKNGKTFLHILKFCKEMHMTGIDLWEPHESNLPGTNWDHKKNLLYVESLLGQLFDFNDKRFNYNEDRYKLIKGRTDQAHTQIDNKSANFVFIDADHQYGAVIRDIELYEPKVTDAVIGHDIDWPDVKKAVEDHYGDAYTVRENDVWVHYL